MLDRGVLVEASHCYLHALTDVTAIGAGIASRWMDAPISQPQGRPTGVLSTELTQLLLAASGVHGPVDPDRAYSRDAALRVFVLMPIPCADGVEPLRLSVFDSGANEGPLGRARQDVDWSTVLRAMPDPYELRQAAAVMVFVVDLRHADQYWSSADGTRQMILATGSALQRCVDRASALGREFRIASALDGARLGALCGTPAHAVLGCGVLLSAAPTVPSDELQSAPLSVRLQWAAQGADGYAGHIVRATVPSPATHGALGWGRASDPWRACEIAISEIAERHSYREIRKPLVHAAGRSLTLRVDPRDLVRFSDAQYADSRRGVVPYRDDELRYWVEGVETASGQAAWLPADCVFHANSLPADAKGQLLMKPTSSGCASDVSGEVALSRAAHELIERDALGRHWLAQRPALGIALDSIPVDLQARIARLEALGVVVDIGILQAELGPAFVVGLTSEARGFCAIGSASGDMPLEAAERALSEAEAGAFVRLQYSLKSLVKADAVATPEDHGNLFAQRRHFRRAHAMVRGGHQETFAKVEAQWPGSVAARLASHPARPSLFCVDLTAPDAPLSLHGHRIRTVRALIPGTVPIAFGFDALPLGMGAPSCKAGRFPHPLP